MDSAPITMTRSFVRWRIRDRGPLLFLTAAFLLGALLRLSFPRDIEYKFDENWMFEKTQEVAAGGPWPTVGMPSSQGIVNPGLSVWFFIGLQKLSGTDTPVGLARAVQVSNIIAILILLLFISRAVPLEERTGWYWGAALICVNPLSVLLHRKIWAQSMLPLLAMFFLIGWWHRKRHWSTAFLWGLAGALLGQIHMAGFFLTASVLVWTILFDRERKAISWIAWTTGTLLGAIGLIPWLIEVSKHVGQTGPAFHVSAWFNFKWWNYWISNSTGLVMEYSLGKHFWSFLQYPLIDQRPTCLVAILHVALGFCALYVLRLALLHLKNTRGEWPARWTGTRSESSLAIASYLWGCGILITAFGVAVQRHYLLVTFPLASVWFARFLASEPRQGARVFGLLWSAELLVTVFFLYYIHVNGGAPNGDYGLAYSAIPAIH
jgi:hypothetical protein